MVKLVRKEEANKYPKVAKDLLNIDRIPNWVELDLSGFPTLSLIGTGLRNVKNSGVFIHPDDLPRIKDRSVNFPEILSHSHGKSYKGSLVYRDRNDGKLVSVPIPVMNKIKRIQVLSEVDTILHLGRTNLTVYTTGSNNNKGFIIPNTFYGINEGRTSASETDFTVTYTSLFNIDKQSNSYIEKKAETRITKEESIVLLEGLIDNTYKKARDKNLKKALMKELCNSIDQELFDEEINEETVKENISDIKDLGSEVFKNIPKIFIYTYNMYFSTQNQVNGFLALLGLQAIPPEIEDPSIQSVNRNEVEGNIYVFRPDLKNEKDEGKRKHILSILTYPQDKYTISRAINKWDDQLLFSSNGYLNKVISDIK